MIRLVVITIVVILIVKLAVSRLEPIMVFFPLRGENETPASLGIRYEALRLRTPDGVNIAAWQLEPGAAKADIVYFHGNGGNLSLWLPVFAALHSFGYRVLAIDYRGYGSSEGSPSERGLALDAEAAVRHAAASRPAPDSGQRRPLVYWGRSLGGPVAAVAARLVPPDALVLESTFPDKTSVVRWNPVLRALNLFSSYGFDTAGPLRGFDKPVLVVHGDADRIIPYSLGRELFERLDAPKRFVTLRGADHNDFFDARHEAYWAPIRAFLDAL
ncbi:MAG: alpha/beta hydrolase [Vicinamibacterales bacterium]